MTARTKVVRFLRKHKHWIIFLLLLVLYQFSCKKTIDYKPVPVVTTTRITEISPTSALSGGTVTSDAGTVVSARGVCYSTNPSPTITDRVTMNGHGTGNYSSELKGLSPNTKYYLRAYAINYNGTGYGEEFSFTTLPEQVPVVTTLPVKDISFSTATVSGMIVSNGGAIIREKGFCWSADTVPTLRHSIITIADDTFSGKIAGLKSSTKYYLRAYTVNQHGIGYGNTVSFTTMEQPPGTVLDIDHNLYHTVIIGSQQWLVENLLTTRLNDGTVLPTAIGGEIWSSLSTPAYSWYLNNESYKNIYGALYNWYSINTKKLCPVNWHVPSDSEWTVLNTYLGNNAGTKMKENGNTHWIRPNSDATNESGFTGLPGGYRSYNGSFYYIGSTGYWWSSTERDPSKAWALDLNTYGTALYRISTYKTSGFSVRCVHN